MQTSESVFESQITSKRCCYKLLDVLYARLEKTDVNSMESRINRAYCSDVKTGKELTMAITKYVCFMVCIWQGDGLTMLDLLRKQ